MNCFEINVRDIHVALQFQREIPIKDDTSFNLKIAYIETSLIGMSIPFDSCPEVARKYLLHEVPNDTVVILLCIYIPHSLTLTTSCTHAPIVPFQTSCCIIVTNSLQ